MPKIVSHLRVRPQGIRILFVRPSQKKFLIAAIHSAFLFSYQVFKLRKNEN